MKLLNPKGCLLSLGGGNNKKQTTLVEGEWMGFRTRVRLPPGPAKGTDTNPYPNYTFELKCGIIKKIHVIGGSCYGSFIHIEFKTRFT